MKNQVIDIVMIWVDGSDPDWIKLFNQYAPDSNKKNIDIRESRYKEYGLLKYWFRSIEKNAPWVRKIHFVTNGQKPYWLDDKAPKLNWVKHSDYMNEEYLPTFSSHPIELNLHRIKDLSENFIYFNDDIYLINKIKPNYFFKNNLPVMYVKSTLGWLKSDDFFAHIPYNNLKLINEKFRFNKIVRKHPFKWLFMNSPKNNLSNFIFSFQNYVPGFKTLHQANPYKKSTYEQVWNLFYNELNETCLHKFRNKTDVNQYLLFYWQLCTGNFFPRIKNTSKFYNVSKENLSKIKNCFTKKSIKLLCLNDDENLDTTNVYENIIELFEKKFPEKSSFEK